MVFFFQEYFSLLDSDKNLYEELLSLADRHIATVELIEERLQAEQGELVDESQQTALGPAIEEDQLEGDFPLDHHSSNKEKRRVSLC